MEFQVARLQEIANKIQYFSKLHFKNPIDIEVVLEAEGLDVADINKLISAGIRSVGFAKIEHLLENENLLLPCKKIYLGELEGENLDLLLTNFELIESITVVDQVRKISDVNARAGRVSSLLVKLNVFSDIKKFGFTPMEISESCYEMAKMSGVRVIGLQTSVPEINNDRMIKTALRKAGTMYKMLSGRFRGFGRFSVNFQDNLEDLIAEGVNEIRIGLNSLK